MKKLNLSSVTLLAIDCINEARARQAILRCCDDINFAQIKLLGIREIGPITDLRQYSFFVLKRLTEFVHTDFVLLIQWDGFVVNPDGWTDEFLSYDYIGAPWWYSDGLNVGNGGFSLRSKKLLNATARFQFDSHHPEDAMLCRKHRAEFESAGLCWAPEELAAKFSWEGNARFRTYNGSFGFHGKSNIKMFSNAINK